MPTCSRCKTKQPNDQFMNAKGKPLLSCLRCRSRGKSGGQPQQQEYYADPMPYEQVIHFEESEKESSEDESDESESDSEDEFVAECKPCGKTYYNEADATRHAESKAHIKNWKRYHNQ
jgi:hypothetical protein